MSGRAHVPAAHGALAGGVCAAVMLAVTACAGGGPGPVAREASQPAAAVDALSFTPDAAAASTATVTLEAGGSISATAADGTSFELSVPPGAVAGDTEITVTPLSGLTGIEANALRGVLLEPDGLELYEPVRLTITPVDPIPVAEQVMFEARGDGTNAGLALTDPASEPIVLLLDHFSVAGIATASEAQRALFLEKSAANAEERLGRQVRQYIGEERERQLLGTSDDESGATIPRDALDAIRAEFEREVLGKRRLAAAASCRALEAYVRSAISWERAQQMTGATDEASSAARVLEALEYANSRYEECEKEAIGACQGAGDAEVLIRFWLWAERPVDKARAEKTCLPRYDVEVTALTGGGIVELDPDPDVIPEVRTVVITTTLRGRIEGAGPATLDQELAFYLAPGNLEAVGYGCAGIGLYDGAAGETPSEGQVSTAVPVDVQVIAVTDDRLALDWGIGESPTFISGCGQADAMLEQEILTRRWSFDVELLEEPGTVTYTGADGTTYTVVVSEVAP